MPKDILVTVVYQSGISPSRLLHEVSSSPESLGHLPSPPWLGPQAWTPYGPLSQRTQSNPSCPRIALTSGKKFHLEDPPHSPDKDRAVAGFERGEKAHPKSMERKGSKVSLGCMTKNLSGRWLQALPSCCSQINTQRTPFTLAPSLRGLALCPLVFCSRASQTAASRIPALALSPEPRLSQGRRPLSLICPRTFLGFVSDWTSVSPT